MSETPNVPVSVVVFTFNEEIHMPSCLGSLSWCSDLIVVDSFSADRTLEISGAYGARCFQHSFSGFGDQRNWALENVKPRFDWILILDADERTTPEFVDELAKAVRAAGSHVGAFRVRRRFHMWGRWLKHSSLYPSWMVRVVRQGRVQYVNRGHAESQTVDGVIADLQADLIDENLKGIEDWFDRQNRYSSKDAQFELALASTKLDVLGALSLDPLRRRAALKQVGARIPFRSTLYFLYSYFLRSGWRDGKDGFVFCLMRAMYQSMVSAKKHDLLRRVRDRGQNG